VCVHRLLAAAIGVEALPVHLSSKSYLHDLAANMNRRHRAAQMAGRSSVQLHTLIVFSGDNNGKEEDAYVLDVDTNENAEPSFTVIVPRYGIEGRVRLSHIKADDPRLHRDAARHTLSFKEDDTCMTSIQVFEKVRVRIWVNIIQESQKELMIDLVSPTFGKVTDKKTSSKRVSSSVLPDQKKKKRKS
jgi:exosome complex exonuclease DIS3/RRP44